MKKMICFVLFAILFLFYVPMSSRAAEEILFRDIPWGSDVATVNKTMKKAGVTVKLPKKPDLAYLSKQIISMRYMTVHDDSEFVGNSYSKSSMKTKIAGYKVSDVSLFFVYRPENGTIIIDNKHASFGAGSYTFNTKDTSGLFDDIEGKLIETYGQYNYKGDEETLFSVFGNPGVFWISDMPDEYYTIWETAQTYLVLQRVDSHDSYTKDHVSIFYISKDMDKWISESINTIIQGQIDEDRSHYGDGDTSGL